MQAKEFAAMITGREYPFDLTQDELAIAKASNLLIVYGQSDDLLELQGAICDECGAYDGTTAYVIGCRLVGEEEFEEDSEVLKKYALAVQPLKIDIEWAPRNPHASWLVTVEGGEPFDILEDGELYCRGAVVALPNPPSSPDKPDQHG